MLTVGDFTKFLGHLKRSTTVFRLEGTVRFSKDVDAWPRPSSGGKPLPGAYFENLSNVTFTSSEQGKHKSVANYLNMLMAIKSLEMC